MSSLYLFITDHTDHTDHTDLTIGPWPSCQGERFSWVQAPCPSTCWEHPPGPSHRCWPSGSPSALIRAPGTKWRRFFCLWGGKHPEVCVCGALPKTKTYRCLDQNYTLQWFAPRSWLMCCPCRFAICRITGRKLAPQTCCGTTFSKKSQLWCQTFTIPRNRFWKPFSFRGK